MKHNTLFITTASWEPRFIEGAKRIIATAEFTASRCLWFEEYGERTALARKEFAKLVTGIDHQEIELQLCSSIAPECDRPIPSYVTTWKAIHKMMAEILPKMNSFVLDITTMPRETLWITLDLLTDAGMPGKIIYHRAEKHGSWCGCEPDRPHIVPKLGGVPSLDGPTKLLILSGYDEDRSEQLIASFEPDETLILFQEGMHEENKVKNEKKHRSRFGNRQTISFDSINCYSLDWGFARVQEVVSNFAFDSNLILASLGPKTSAVSLYRLQRHFQKSGLVYSPCRSYNIDYSVGIDDTLSLDWIPEKMIPHDVR